MMNRHSITRRILACVLCISMMASLLSGCARQTEEIKNNNPVDVSSLNIDTEAIVEAAVEEIVGDRTNSETIQLSTNWESYQGDLEVFVYGLIANQLGYKYDVFPASVELNDGTQVSGIGYTNYEECYVDDDEETYCFAAGFIPCIGEIPIPQEDFDAGLQVQDLEYSDPQSSFVLMYGSEPFAEHCVVYGQYLTYGVDDEGSIFYTSTDYSREVCDESLGSLYSFDSARFLYDLDVGQYANVTGTSLYELINYADLEAEINRILETQDLNFATVDVESCAYLAQEAVASYLLSLQEETFFGYSVSELVTAAEELDPLECFRMTANGPVVLSMDYDGGASSLAKWLVGTGCVIVTAVSLVGAVVVIECPLLSALSGAMAGTAIEIFMEVVISGETLENVDWGKVALAAAAGAVSGYLGPYIYATRSGAAYFMVDSSLDGLIGGIEHAARAWMDGEDGAHVIKSFGYGFAIGFALSAGFKAVGSIVEKLASRAAPSLAKLAEKVFPKLTAKVSALSAGFGKTIQQMKRAADASIFHSKYISKKLAQKQLMRLIEEGSDELVEKAFANLGSSDIVDKNGELMTKQALRDIFDKADDGATLAYFKRGDELVAIVKKHSMIGIVFDSSKYQTVTLPTELIADRGVNMEEAAKLLKKQWLDDPTLIPESLANAIKANGVDLEDMLPEDLVSIIQKSDWVLHENIDMRTVSLVPGILHDKGIGGIGHMGGYALAKYIKEHMGILFFDRFVSAAATNAVLAAP